MDITHDLIMARLAFSSQDHENGDVSTTIVRRKDAKLSFHDIFDLDINTLQIYGVKVLNLRRSTTAVFDNEAKVVQHSVQYLLHSLTVFSLSFIRSYRD